MTNKQRDRLLKRLNSDTKLKSMINESIRKDTKIKILEFVSKRMFNKITQDYMAKTCKVSLSTIKRFEALKIDSLNLFQNYKLLLGDLSSIKKRKVPKWVYQ